MPDPTLQTIIPNSIVVSQRPRSQWHDNRPTWDIYGVTSDGLERNGLIWESKIKAFLPTVGDSVPVKWFTGPVVEDAEVRWDGGSEVKVRADNAVGLVDYRDIGKEKWGDWNDPRIVHFRFTYTCRAYKAPNDKTK